MKRKSFKIALSAIYTVFALISFVVESLLPPLYLPGARIGLSNIFILLAVITVGWQYGFIALAVKCLLGSLFVGNFSAVIYSLPAGAIALAIEIIILRFIKKSSVVSVSVAGGVINVLLQNLIFCLVTKSTAYLAYLPYLALIGAVAGAVVGLIVFLIIKKFPSFEKDDREKIMENEIE